MTEPEVLIAKWIANRVGRDYEHIDVMMACELLDHLKSEGWQLVEKGEPYVPEVEVTRTDLALVPQESPLVVRRSGAKNVSAPEYQTAFISEARHAMGQPTVEDVKALMGKEVVLTFNVDWRPAQGKLTDVVTHPSAGTVNLILDNYRERVYPLNAIQEIKRVP
jgi:hypothetical protein